MYCSKCGTEIEKDSSFCTKCGNKLENYSQTGSITLAREKQFYGVLIPISVFIDGKKVANVNAGGEVKVPIEIGEHRLAFNLWSGNGQYDVEVKEENPNIKVTFKLGVGLITSKPKIVSITNI